MKTPPWLRARSVQRGRWRCNFIEPPVTDEGPEVISARSWARKRSSTSRSISATLSFNTRTSAARVRTSWAMTASPGTEVCCRSAASSAVAASSSGLRTPRARSQRVSKAAVLGALLTAAEGSGQYPADFTTESSYGSGGSHSAYRNPWPASSWSSFARAKGTPWWATWTARPGCSPVHSPDALWTASPSPPG